MNDYFNREYAELIQEGSGGIFNRYIHRQLETNLNKSFYNNVLELGSLNGYHKQFVNHKYNMYYETDILNKQTEKITNNYVRKYQDAENLIDFEDCSIDRVLATCLLSHLKDPEKCLLEIKRVIKRDGVISLWVANDPSILLRVLQVLFRKSKFKKLGLNYDSLQYRQHISYFTRIDYLINDIFSEFRIKKKSLPINNFWYHFNLATVYQIYS